MLLINLLNQFLMTITFSNMTSGILHSTTDKQIGSINGNSSLQSSFQNVSEVFKDNHLVHGSLFNNASLNKEEGNEEGKNDLPNPYRGHSHSDSEFLTSRGKRSEQNLTMDDIVRQRNEYIESITQSIKNYGGCHVKKDSDISTFKKHFNMHGKNQIPDIYEENLISPVSIAECGESAKGIADVLGFMCEDCETNFLTIVDCVYFYKIKSSNADPWSNYNLKDESFKILCNDKYDRKKVCDLFSNDRNSLLTFMKGLNKLLLKEKFEKDDAKFQKSWVGGISAWFLSPVNYVFNTKYKLRPKMPHCIKN